MVKNIFRWLTIIFQSIAIGALILYTYSYFRYRSTWELLDSKVKSNINTYLILGLISLGIFIVIKVINYILFREKKVITENKVSDKIEYQNDEIISNIQTTDVPKREEIPKERQAICPNCKSVVDKEAYICLACGILLNNIEDLQPKQEKIVYKEVVVKNQEGNSKGMFTNLILMVLVVLIMFVAYDYTRNNGVFFNEEMSQLEKKQYIYSLATEVLNSFVEDLKNNRVRLDRNNSYFSLSDLGYNSLEYNPTKSYIAVNDRAKEYYIILEGQGKYEEYSIDTTLKNELDLEDVKTNTAVTVPTNDTLFIDGQMFYKGEN